ncbi:MAG: dipeptidase [Aggregatilineales bacterium]
MPDPSIILDAHLDIAYNVLRNGRVFTDSVYKQRRREAQLSSEQIKHLDGMITVALPEMLLGRVGIAFATIFVSPASNPEFGDEKISYATPRQAHDRAREQLTVYQRLADDGLIELIRTKAELERTLATWRDGTEFAQHRLGVVISIEGADPILEPRQFEEWYEWGVRAVGPAWGGTRYSGGAVGNTYQPGPLTSLGRELLEVMAGFNAILDVSHMAEESFFEALDRYGGTLIASHSNARRFYDSPRNLTDDMIRQLAERGGVIGIPLYNRFLKRDWRPNHSRKDEVTLLGDVIPSIDHICQLTGSVQHVGIGSDMDGGFGWQSIPAEFDTVADEYLIGPALRARGYREEDVAAVLSGNFLRILRQTLPN